DAGDVRQQGVEPDVDRELRVEWNADAPLLTGARNVDVPQSLRPDQADDFVLADLRLNEIRVRLVVCGQSILERRELEEVARLRPPGERGPVVRAEAGVLLVLLIALELLAPLAVPALEPALVDVPVVVHLLDEFPARRLVPLVAGLNEDVVADLQ